MPWKPDYATVGELRSYKRIDKTIDDVELGLAISSASRTIDTATGRQFGNTGGTQTRTYRVHWNCEEGLWLAVIDDVMTLTGFVVTVDGAPVAGGDYELRPLNADLDGEPWWQLYLERATSPTLGRGPGRVAVTATFGWTAVPTTIHEACMLQASKFFVDRTMPHGIAGSPELGNEMRLLDKLHPDAELMIRNYMRSDAMVGGIG